MVQFRVHHIQMSLASSRRYFKAYHVRKAQIVRVAAISSKGPQLKKTIHTSPWNDHFDNNKNRHNNDEGDDYELDLITMTRKKKSKKRAANSSKHGSSRDEGTKSQSNINISDDSNVRSDNYKFKTKRYVNFLDSEDVRMDDDLVSLSSKELKKNYIRKQMREQHPPPIESLFKISRLQRGDLSEENVEIFDELLIDQLTTQLDFEYDRQMKKESKKSKTKVKANRLLDIVSGGLQKGGLPKHQTQEAKPTKPLLQSETVKNTDSRVDDDLVFSKSSSNSDSKSDDDLVPKFDDSSEAAEKPDPKSDEDLVPAETASEMSDTSNAKSDDHLVEATSGEHLDVDSSIRMERNLEFEDDKCEDTHVGSLSEMDKDELQEYMGDFGKYEVDMDDDRIWSKGHEKEVNQPIEAQAKSNKEVESGIASTETDKPDVINVTVPNLKKEQPETESTKYNFTPPVIEGLEEEIANVSIPQPTTKDSNKIKKIEKRNKAFVSELTKLSPEEKINKIDDIMNLLQNELPKLSQQRNMKEDQIYEKSLQLQHMRKKLDELNKAQSEGIEDLNIPLKELQGFLNGAKRDKEIKDDTDFRQARAYEFSKALNDKRLRTLERNDFFTPVDEALAKKFTTFSNRLRPLQHPEIKTAHDELFFPSLTGAKNLTHEFMILANKKKVVTNENPLGESYHTPDLFTLFRNLGDPEKYMKQINKLEKRGGWKLIGSGGDTNKILIFERFIDKEQEKKNNRRRTLRNYTLSIVSAFGLMLAAGAYYEHQEKIESTLPKYKFDESGKFVKANSK